MNLGPRSGDPFRAAAAKQVRRIRDHISGRKAEVATHEAHAEPVFAAIVWMLSLVAPAAAGPLEDATAADDKGDYATALQLLRSLVRATRRPSSSSGACTMTATA